MDLLYGIRILALDYFLLSSTMLGRTDRQTDRRRQQDRAYVFAVTRCIHLHVDNVVARCIRIATPCSYINGQRYA